MVFASIFFALLLSSSASKAAEADHFTSRTLNVADIAESVNILANDGLKKALLQVNRVGSCDEANLYVELQKIFANHSDGQLVKDILYGKKVPLTMIPLKESIYKEWTIWDGYLLGRKKAAQSPLALTPMVRIGDQIVGVDKFEHMFGMGFIYFKNHYLKGKPLVSVLKNGVFREKTALGGNLFATGVFSYGDLSANFNGMRFWNHLLQKHDDVLGKSENLGPYVECQSGKWTVNSKKPIDFRNYIDASMDESINCSKFARASGEEKFRNSLVRLSFVGSKGASVCPVEPDKLKAIEKKYESSGVEEFIINPKGTGQVSYFSEIHANGKSKESD